MGELKIDILELLKKGAIDDDLRRRLLSALQTPAQLNKMTFEEFLDWLDEDIQAEWVNGEVFMTSPVSKQHQDLTLFLGQVVGIFVTQKGLSHVLVAPFQMKIVRSSRKPDLLFVSNGRLEHIKETFLDGPADLVVEIVSPESISRDRGEKFVEYEQAGIPEYWLIDPERQRAEFYQLDQQGRYELISPDSKGVYLSKVLPGFWLQIAWFWKIPPVVEVLHQMALI